MTFPTASPPPDAPLRSQPADFPQKAETWVAWLSPFTVELNAIVEWINNLTPDFGMFETWRNEVVAANTAAQTALTGAQEAEANAAAIQDSLQGLADSPGGLSFEATKASADAATWAEGDVVEVQVDETMSNHRTRYKYTGGALVFMIDMDAFTFDDAVKDLEAQSLLSAEQIRQSMRIRALENA